MRQIISIFDAQNFFLIFMNIFVICSIIWVIYFENAYSVNINDEFENEDSYDFIFDPNQYYESYEEEDDKYISKSEKDKKNPEQISNEKINENSQKQEHNQGLNEILKADMERFYIDQLVDDTTTNNKDINIVAAGDWYCNEETKKTIKNILQLNPELIITTGDHVKDVDSANCWKQISKPIKDIMRIAIGNHDTEFASIYKQIVQHHELQNPYYSHDFENIHFISMSTEHPFEKGSKQYEFIKNDLEKASKNPNIDWIIVHQHKPFYSTKQDKQEAEDLRDIFQPLYQKYNVDLVMSSHNQYYERTYPLSYNKKYEMQTDKQSIPKPIIKNNSKLLYQNVDGIIFLTVGTAGDELDAVTENHEYYVVQESKHGFLNINIKNHGKTLMFEFISNDGKVIDEFYLDKHNV